MSGDQISLVALGVILLMALVTLGTRVGGLLIMSRVPIGPRTERFINGMAGSVLVAVLVPNAVHGDWAARLALLATLGVMLTLHRPLLAIAVGIVTAAGWRLW